MNKLNNIVFWAHSYCRSTLKFYSELAKNLGKNCYIYTWIKDLDLRTSTGFSNAEFKDLKVVHIGDDYELAKETLMKHLNDYNIFCAYQACPIYQHLIRILIKRKSRYGIISEAPCNMHDYPKRIINSVYQRIYLPFKLKDIIENADFIMNASGYYETELHNLGWKDTQIISCGYYPPRLPGSKLVERNEKHWSDFTILLSGLHQWHRSPWILLEALSVLKGKGIMPKCYITQSGPYIEKAKKYATKHQLSNVDFLGFVEMPKLIQLYETCSVYVGCGNYEPWGMRLNDCLLCGTPLIVNRGMGGVKLVDQYDCGLSFNRNDCSSLAEAIESLMTDKSAYLKIARKAVVAANAILPENAAKEYADRITDHIV
ncbi:glycosyltransferase [Bacteroides uniformis]|uniref:glycosyltransferase n=1 Tax=Bacteroides uniformis TaxID=820 RepID=UPI001EE880DF|nr:glycosyltransferase [Bacteroides uniformis]